jgi:hypothetical protein
LVDAFRDPFGAATRLSGAAAAEKQPDAPGVFGRELFDPGVAVPVLVEEVELVVIEPLQCA